MYSCNTFCCALPDGPFELQGCFLPRRFESLTSLNFEFGYSELLEGDSLRAQVYKKLEWERVWRTVEALPNLRRVTVALFGSARLNGRLLSAEGPNADIGDSIFEPLMTVRKLGEFVVQVAWTPYDVRRFESAPFQLFYIGDRGDLTGMN